MNRHEEREQTFLLLFESEFSREKEAEEVYATAKEARDVGDSPYIHTVLGGVREKREELDALISAYSNGWNRDRISGVASAVMLLSVYEMLYTDIPRNVSINEAMELMKKYDEDKGRVFVNGVLNAISKDEKVLRRV